MHHQYQRRNMDVRRRARESLAHMRRYIQNLKRKVIDLTNMLANQRIIRREAYDDETIQGNVNQHIEHEEKQVGHMTFE